MSGGPCRRVSVEREGRVSPGGPTSVSVSNLVIIVSTLLMIIDVTINMVHGIHVVEGISEIHNKMFIMVTPIL